MKNRGKILILAAVALAAGLWTWRFISLNSYYHGLVGDMGEDRVYAVGNTVPMDYAEGYSLRADGFEIVGFEDIDPDLFAETYAARSGAEGKLGLLSVTLFNIDSEKEKFNLPDLRLRGEDTIFNVEEGLLKGLNPSLEGHTSTTLRKGESCSFVLPYILYKAQFPFSWTHLDRCSLYLNVTINSDIRLQ